MAKKSNSTCLHQYLARYVAPALKPNGFVLQRGNSFNRFNAETGSVEIINFQLGVKSLVGKFTINLSVYNPAFHPFAFAAPTIDEADQSSAMMKFRTRLGFLMETKTTRFFQQLFGRDKWWHEIFAPHDKWWSFSQNEKRMAPLLDNLARIIVAVGIPWLNERDRIENLRAECEIIKKRIRQVGAQTAP